MNKSIILFVIVPSLPPPPPHQKNLSAKLLYKLSIWCLLNRIYGYTVQEIIRISNTQTLIHLLKSNVFKSQSVPKYKFTRLRDYHERLPLLFSFDNLMSVGGCLNHPKQDIRRVAFRFLHPSSKSVYIPCFMNSIICYTN